MTTKTSAEFWAHERWPKARVPTSTWLQRLTCRLLGHAWDTHYWSGQGEPGWPQHDYCTCCWKFRDKPEADRREQRQTVVTMNTRARR